MVSACVLDLCNRGVSVTTQWLVPVCFIFVSGGSVTEWLVLVCACVSQYSSDWFLELPFFIL